GRRIRFSIRACFPWFRARIACSAWYSALFHPKPASRSSWATRSSALSYPWSMPYASPTCASNAGETSQIAAISYRSSRLRSTGRWMTCATSPNPIRPTLTRSTPNLAFQPRPSRAPMQSRRFDNALEDLSLRRLGVDVLRHANGPGSAVLQPCPASRLPGSANRDVACFEGEQIWPHGRQDRQRIVQMRRRDGSCGDATVLHEAEPPADLPGQYLPGLAHGTLDRVHTIFANPDPGCDVQPAHRHRDLRAKNDISRRHIAADVVLRLLQPIRAAHDEEVADRRREPGI